MAFSTNRIIIPKSQTPKRIQENIDILDFNLELTEVAEIDALNRNARQGKNPDDVENWGFKITGC